MTAEIIDGKSIARELRRSLKEEVAAFTDQAGSAPHLVAVLVGEDPASQVYVRNKEKACHEAGIRGTVHRLPAATTQQELLDLVGQLNRDADVDGILVQLPLPSQIDEQAVLDAVSPWKDVDCFHAENVGLMAQGRPRFLPCTPHGCLHLLQASGIETEGRHAVVVGRSEIVGKPVAMMLVQKSPNANATVTIAHSRTQDLAEVVRQGDIVIAAIGRPRAITAEMIKPGAVVIDVGINRVDGQLVGDVDFEPVREIAGAITPVPGGVGPMTIAMLLQNTLTAARLRSQRPG